MKQSLFYKYLFLLPAITISCLLHGQEVPPQESAVLVTRIQTATSDTAKATALLRYGDFLIDYNKDSSIAVLQQALMLEAATRRSFTLGKGHLLLGVAYAEKGNYPKAKEAYEHAARYYAQGRHYTELAKTYNNMGNLYNFQGMIEEAVAQYLLAMEMVEKKGAAINIGVVFNNIAAGLQKLGQYEKSLYYCIRGEQLARQQGDSIELARLLVAKSAAQLNTGNAAAGEKSIREAFTISEKTGFLIGKALSLVNLADLHFDRGRYDSALVYQLRAKPWAEQAGDPYYLNAVYYGLGKTYASLNQLSAAAENLEAARKLAAGVNDKAHLVKIWRTLSDVYAAQHQYRQSLEALQQADLYADSLQNETIARQVHQLETRFRTAEKDKALAQQQLELVRQSAELKTKNGVLLLTVGGLAALVVISVLGYRNYRQQQRLQAHRLIALQKEKETEALHAMMNGEERERIRIARELHDGVGSELSAARMYLEHLGAHFTGTNPPEVYHEALLLVEGAATEIRKTAHNLMPEVLHQHGLAEAVQTFCSKMGRGSSPEVEFQCYGTARRLNSSFELMAYRMVQELLHNALRHAHATHVLVQLSFGEGMLSLTVEDNGNGFDAAALEKNNSGIGLSSLYSRVTAFGGRLDIDTALGKGTAIYIEFNLDKFTEPTCV